MAAEPSRLLRWYPPAWRERYGDDLVMYMQDSFGEDRPPLRARLSIVAGGIEERIRLAGLRGDSVPPAERIRAAALVVLCSWTAFVIAGCNLAKLSEHFDQALPRDSGSHQVPDLAYAAIQIAAAVAGMAVIAGAVLAAPAVVRFLRSGGWPAVRRWALLSTGSTAVLVALSIPLSDWAHHLSDHQRNGGSAGYTALFLTWAVLFSMTLVLWTATAVAAARRVPLSRRLLRAEAGLAVLVAAAMLVILAATGVWWAALAVHAPLFLNSDPSVPANGRLICTAVVMAVSAAGAGAAVVRVKRTWRQLPTT